MLGIPEKFSCKIPGGNRSPVPVEVAFNIPTKYLFLILSVLCSSPDPTRTATGIEPFSFVLHRSRSLQSMNSL